MRRRQIEDALMAAGAVTLLIFGTQVAAQTRVPPFKPLDAPAYLLLVVAGLALAGRARFPVAVLATTLGCSAALAALHYPYGPVFLTLVVALYTVTVHRSLPHGVAAFTLGGAALTAADLVSGGAPSNAVVWYSSMLIPYGVGLIVRANTRARLATAEAEWEQTLRRAQEERLAIAREIHDVLGHSLTLINMRAGVALHVAARRPDQALEALETIKRTSGDALRELRATLEVVRDRAPSAGLDGLGALVASMDSTGVTVELTVLGASGDVRPAVGHAVYRIVQESLTNVLRHSGARRATVTVDHGPEATTVEIADDGTALDGPEGSGISGMRERAAALGGALTAGPLSGGGFAVRARFPVTREGVSAMGETGQSRHGTSPCPREDSPCPREESAER
ncbi:sensor histidine kinase [Streptosporangium carneum]|uniref:histidine kinase n=1 Tax=Streptosporangium carneum TaxID=47481 RepID=A0A9W6I021_9ACTN|nr:histidine kinase [Streptosporangium carneum]GLK09525.1 two-component sensor histidine kinase [Streptosporangium carneum]